MLLTGEVGEGVSPGDSSHDRPDLDQFSALPLLVDQAPGTQNSIVQMRRKVDVAHSPSLYHAAA
jgi:hypothetical protein